MRPGFLGRAPPAGAAPAGGPAGGAAGGGAAGGGPPELRRRQQQQQQPKEHAAEAVQAEAAGPSAPEQRAAAWRQCMELLRSDADEKKFVGLLLVTKLLPGGGDTAVRDVLDAVGFSFLQRLLLPLRQRQWEQEGEREQHRADAAKLQQQHLSAVLGLSILSTACRLGEVAAGDDVVQLLPLLLKVAAAGGVAPLLLPPGGPAGAAGGAWADEQAEAAAAADALECALACASSGAYQRAVALESNAFPAAAAALAGSLAAAEDAAAPHDGAAAAAAGPPGGSLQRVMLATRLLSLLLDGGAAAQIAEQRPAEAAGAVMLLAQAFGSAFAGSSDLGAGGGSGGAAAASGGGNPDSAALQLEAQRALLLLLPLREGSEAAELLQQARAAASGAGAAPPALAAAAEAAGDWPAALRRGLLLLLCGRVGAVQRHSALQLAAAALELLGPGWLLPEHGARPQRQPQQRRPRVAPGVAGGEQQLLLVLMEVLSVETPLLLSDAMNPRAVVPREDQGMAAREAAAAVLAGGAQQRRGMDVDGGDDDEDDGGEGGGSSSGDEQRTVPAPLTVRQALQGQGQQHAGDPSAAVPPGFQQQQRLAADLSSLRERMAGMQLPQDRQPGPGEQTAGERALQCLPSCFALLEGCLEVLVRQVGLLEQLADAGAAAASPAGSPEPPALGAAEVDQLMGRLHGVTQVVCEFLDHAALPPPEQSAADAAAVDPLLAAGAVRLLGRFLADAPDAHEGAVRALLPRLLRLAVPGEPAAAGVAFLMPALLSWTSAAAGSGGSHAQWVAALLDPAGGCLEHLCGYAAVQAAAAAAAAAAAPAGGGAPAEELGSAEAQLGTACLALQQLLAAAPAALSRQQGVGGGGAAQAGKGGVALGRLSDQQRQALCQLLSALGGWGAVRRAQSRCGPAGGGAGAGADRAAVRAASLLAAAHRAAVGLPALLPAAAVSGQLLALLPAEGAAASTAGPAGQLLAWGCEAGWSYRLLEEEEDEERQLQGQRPQRPTVGEASAALLEAGEAWRAGELGDVWDACLTAAADLLLSASASGASVAAALSGAPSWLDAAAAVASSTLDGGEGAGAAAAQAVVEGSTGLQLLARAWRRGGG